MSKLEHLSILARGPELIEQRLHNTALPPALGITAVEGMQFGDQSRELALPVFSREAKPFEGMFYRTVLLLPNGSGTRLYDFFVDHFSGRPPLDEVYDDASFSAYVAGETRTPLRKLPENHTYGDPANAKKLTIGGHYALRSQLEELQDERLPHFVAVTEKDALLPHGPNGGLVLTNATELAAFHGPVDVVRVVTNIANGSADQAAKQALGVRL